MAPIASPSRPYGPDPHISLVGQAGRGNVVDLAVVILGFIILPLDLPAAQPLRLPMTLVVLAYTAWHARTVLPV
ncbi:MAG: hypothetical protein AAF723_07805, partial [Pseudomonadota bacterium]